VNIPRTDALVTKSDQLRQALREGRDIDALRIGKSFRMLQDQKVAIQRAWDAYQNAHFHRQIGRDPDELVREGIKALKKLYPV